MLARVTTARAATVNEACSSLATVAKTALGSAARGLTRPSDKHLEHAIERSLALWHPLHRRFWGLTASLPAAAAVRPLPPALREGRRLGPVFRCSGARALTGILRRQCKPPCRIAVASGGRLTLRTCVRNKDSHRRSDRRHRRSDDRLRDAWRVRARARWENFAALCAGSPSAGHPTCPAAAARRSRLGPRSLNDRSPPPCSAANPIMKNRRRPTLPGGCPPSTIGAERLNCSVRNGKRCLPLAMRHRNFARPPRWSLKTAQDLRVKISVKPSTH